MKIYRLILTSVIFLSIVTPCSIADCPQFKDGLTLGTIESNLVDEASGIACSRKNKDVLWTHNDSGGLPRIFAMNKQGRHLGIYNLSGVISQDWEDIAVGPGPIEDTDYLFIGDIGDNDGIRPFIKIYRVPEPAVDANQSPVTTTLTNVETITLQFPDSPKDAETLMVDPPTRDIYIISKRQTNSKLYRAAYPQSTEQTITMQYSAQLPWGWATAGDISPDGSLVIVRGYFNASIWQRPADANLWQIFTGPQCNAPLIAEPKGEAICFDANGCGYFTTSENSHQPLYYFPRLGQCPIPADFDNDIDVDLQDLSFLCDRWLYDNCQIENNFCDGADLDKLSTVNIIDFALYAFYQAEHTQQ